MNHGEVIVTKEMIGDAEKSEPEVVSDLKTYALQPSFKKRVRGNLQRKQMNGDLIGTDMRLMEGLN